jgi:hypothetical protein
MRASVETITPQQAAAYLRNARNIRKPNREKILKFAADLRADRWELNGESVKFVREADDDILVDGQNRLTAIIEAKKPARVVVVRDCAGADFIDVGEKRTLAQLLHARGLPYATAIASMIGNLYALREFMAQPERVQSPRPSHADRLALFDRYEKQLTRMAPEIHNRGLHWAAAIGAVLIEAKRPRGYAHAADDFLTCLATGALHEQTLSTVDACYKLREIQLANQRAKTRLSQRARLALIVKAWSYHRALMLMDGPLRFVETGPTAEPFPKFGS